MPDLEIVIRTRAELEGARQAITALEHQIGQAKVLGQDYRALDNQLSAAKSSLGRVQLSDDFQGRAGAMRDRLRELVPGFARLESVVGRIGGGGLALVAGGLAGIGAAAKTAAAGIQEYAAAEQKSAQLDAALAQTGQLNDTFRASLQDLAAELQRTTAIADDEWLPVFTRLIQFGAGQDNIGRLVEAVKNLAGIMGGDIQTSANMLSRAMQGNFDLFSRYGIVVGEAGSQTEKLDRLMLELAQRGHGQLEAASRGLTGQWTALKLSLSDLKEAIGFQIARTGILQGALTMVGGVAQGLANTFGGLIPKVEGLNNAVRTTVQRHDDAASAAKRQEAALKDLETQMAGITSETDRRNGAIDRQLRIENELADKVKARTLAELELAKASGRITEPDYLVRRATIDERFAQDRAVRERTASTAKERNMLDETDAIFRSLKTIDEQVKYERAAVRKGAIESERVKLQTEYDANKEALESVTKKIIRTPPKVEFEGVTTIDNSAELAKLNAERDRLRARQHEIDERLPFYPPQTGYLGSPEKLDDLTGRREMISKRIGQLGGRYSEQIADLQAGRFLTDASVGIDSQTRSIQLRTGLHGAVGQEFDRANQRADQLVDAVKSGDPVKRIEAMGDAVVQKFADVGRAVDSITRRIAQLEMRSGELRNQ